MMQDNKALQAGTSHNLGQNFAKAFELKFQTESGETEHAWNTSWGVSTRMIGGLVMTHGDDNGLRVAAAARADRGRDRSDLEHRRGKARVLEAANAIVAELGDWKLGDARIRIHVDARDTMRSGAKYYEWELRGVPMRLELGPRDLDKQQTMLARRDTREKARVPMAALGKELRDTLAAIQDEMFGEARARREANSIRGDITYDRFKEIMDGPGAFVYAGWSGDPACESAGERRDQGDDSLHSRRGVPLAGGAQGVHGHGQAAKYEACGPKRTDPGFARRDGALRCEDVPLDAIARQRARRCSCTAPA